MRRRWLAASALVLASTAAAHAQAPADPAPEPEPDFTMVVEGTFDPDTVKEFLRRVHEYDALRRQLEVGLPPLVVTSNPDEVEDFEDELADRIEDARRSKRGQIFLPTMAGQLRQMLSRRVDRVTLEVILDDGPPEFDIDVNERYSKKWPLATMPPTILLRLPELPPDLEYRFVGRHFILRDVRANMVVDEIPYVMDCDECDPGAHDDHHEIADDPHDDAQPHAR